MVAISGSINGANGTADNITVLRHVDGPMDDNGVDLATNRLKVMGQDVVVDASTVFDNGITSLADLRTLQGANVNHPELEVHGSADNNGVIHATFIHKGSDDRIAGRDVQVRGTVAGLDTAARRSSIGRKTVDFGVAGRHPRRRGQRIVRRGRRGRCGLRQRPCRDLREAGGRDGRTAFRQQGGSRRVRQPGGDAERELRADRPERGPDRDMDHGDDGVYRGDGSGHPSRGSGSRWKGRARSAGPSRRRRSRSAGRAMSGWRAR